MIERFRRKFIAYATVSIFALLAIIFSAVNITNFTILAASADEVTQLLADANGNFRDEEPPPLPPNQAAILYLQDEEPGDRGPGDFINPETKMSTRYFTVALPKDEEPYIVSMAMDPQTATEEDAIAWAQELKKGDKGWTRTYFRYRVYKVEKVKYVSVIHYSRELAPSYAVLWGSIAGTLAGTLISFLLLIPVSKWLVKPLEASVKKQQRFISDASHELKTPLAIISANAEIIEVEQGESEATHAITKQVGRMNVMVRNLNALAQIDESSSNVVLGNVDLAALSADAVTGFAEAFAAKNVQFTTEIPETLLVKGDEGMLKKLLSVLLDNALKYAKTTAEFHLYHTGERVAVKVINDADGLEEDGPLDQVFERFYRSDAARSSGIEGSGIGLSIAQEITAHHHGRIKAKAEGGKFIIKVEL